MKHITLTDLLPCESACGFYDDAPAAAADMMENMLTLADLIDQNHGFRDAIDGNWIRGPVALRNDLIHAYDDEETTEYLNTDKFRSRLIALLAHRANTLEWGDEEQIAAENGIYYFTEIIYGIQWEDHHYLLKATTDEAMAYVADKCKAAEMGADQ